MKKSYNFLKTFTLKSHLYNFRHPYIKNHKTVELRIKFE